MMIKVTKDRFDMLSADPDLAKQGLSDDMCPKCSRRLWVNFTPTLVCLNGCTIKVE